MQLILHIVFSDSMPRIDSKYLIFLLVAISLATINPRVNGWNEASRMAMTQALVEDHTLQIDESPFADTGDKVLIDGHFYSDKPPLPSLLAAVVYWPLHQLGLTLDYGWNVAYYLIILFTVKMFWLLAAYAFFHSMTYTQIEPGVRPYLTLIFALCSVAFSWSASFNNHTLAGSSLMIGFAFFLQATRAPRQYSFPISGLAFGLAAAMDMPTAIFLVGFGTLLFFRHRSLSNLIPFAGFAVFPLFVHFGVNYMVSTSLLPLQLDPELFDYQGSPWQDSDALSGVRFNGVWGSLVYILKLLFGTHGFLWYNPLLFLLIPALIKNLRSPGAFVPESRVILGGALVMVLYYAVLSSNLSGWSYSIRWFVPLLPLLLFYQFEYVRHWYQPGWRRPLGILLGISLIIAGIGLINPWSNLSIHPIPLLANLRQLLSFQP